MSFIDIRGVMEFLPEQEDVRAVKLLHLVEDYMGKDMAEALEPYLDYESRDKLAEKLEETEYRVHQLEEEVDALRDEIDCLRYDKDD
jgi:ABC-type phosphate transport system auxiliary subunit